MKKVNLLSLSQAHKNINEELLTRYLACFKISIKRDELQDLDSFVNLLKNSSKSIDCFDNYFLGYSIPQIGKEFDLLRFGENYNINIELKRTSTNSKIKEQLIKNKYYLSFLKTNILNFTFVVDQKKLFRLDNNEDLLEEDFEELYKVLDNQKIKEIINVNSLFNPSNYLVSPFNSTNDFINGNYFLTNQQNEIKSIALDNINKNKVFFILISGKAGTGKSLLTYDIAKEFISRSIKVLVIHCGLLNSGHYKLRDEYKWDLIAIKDLYQKDISNYSLIVIDETQRIYPTQLDHIIKEINNHNKSCIFSSDQQQCLRDVEANNKIEEEITNRTSPIKYNLTERIRTNKEIASFILGIFNKDFKTDQIDGSNIELHYFKNYREAKEYIELLSKSYWKIINYTPSKRQSLPYDNYSLFQEDNAHSVIGQEFDNVVAVIDSYFTYQNNELTIRKDNIRPYYHPTKMLFQIMTRTRKKLCLIVIDNSEILSRCLEILEKQTTLLDVKLQVTNRFNKLTPQ